MLRINPGLAKGRAVAGLAEAGYHGLEARARGMGILPMSGCEM
jgi:hypothetical protein